VHEIKSMSNMKNFRSRSFSCCLPWFCLSTFPLREDITVADTRHNRQRFVALLNVAETNF